MYANFKERDFSNLIGSQKLWNIHKLKEWKCPKIKKSFKNWKGNKSKWLEEKEMDGIRKLKDLGFLLCFSILTSPNTYQNKIIPPYLTFKGGNFLLNLWHISFITFNSRYLQHFSLFTLLILLTIFSKFYNPHLKILKVYLKENFPH